MLLQIGHCAAFLNHCRAIKNGKGLHSKKEVPIHRVADISGVRVLHAPEIIVLISVSVLRV